MSTEERWIDVVGSLQQHGMLTGIEEGLVPWDQEVTPSLLMRLIRRHYRIAPDLLELAWRRQRDHYLETVDGQPVDSVVAALRHGWPDRLDGLEARLERAQLIVSVGEEEVALYRMLRHARLDRRMIAPADEPRHVVGGANVLLGRFGVGERFIELNLGRGRRGFIGTSRDGAEVLFRFGLSPRRTMQEALAFGRWEEAPTAAPPRAQAI